MAQVSKEVGTKILQWEWAEGLGGELWGKVSKAGIVNVIASLGERINKIHYYYKYNYF